MPNDFYLRKKMKSKVQYSRVVHVSKKIPKQIDLKNSTLTYFLVFESKAFGLFNLTEMSFI